MKTTITIVLCGVMFLSAQAQSRYDAAFLSSKQAYFLKKGFPATDYQFDNQQINEQLALVWKYKRGVNTKNIIGGSFLTIGGGLAFYGAIAIPTVRSSDPFLGILGAFSNAAKGAVIGTGVATIVVSIPLFTSASSQSHKRNAAMESAKKLYWDLHLPVQEE
jgi:hypothetical protein